MFCSRQQRARLSGSIPLGEFLRSELNLGGNNKGNIQGNSCYPDRCARVGADLIAEHVNQEIGQRVQYECCLGVSRIGIDEAIDHRPGGDAVKLTEGGL